MTMAGDIDLDGNALTDLTGASAVGGACTPVTTPDVTGNFCASGAGYIAGAVTTGSTITSSGSINSGGMLASAATSYHHWTGRSEMYSSADGYWNVTNDATTGFTRATFGPETNQYPAIYPSGAAGATFACGAAITDVCNYTFTGFVSSASYVDQVVGQTATFGTVYTATAAASGAVIVGSGYVSNAADLATGDVTIASGYTTTDGDTGDVILRTGAAGAGAADAGDILLQTHGANTRVTIAGPTGDITFHTNATVGELLYLDDDADSYITGTTTDDVIQLHSNIGGGTGYTEITNSNNAGFLAVGRTTGTEGSRVSITDGNADNTAGELVLYADDGNGNFLWTSTADVFRGANAAPADDDAGGFAIMDLITGAIGSLTQAGLFSGLTTAGIHVNTPGSQELSAAETATVTAKWLKVYSDGGAVVSTADPTVSAGTADGQEACFRGVSDANTIEFEDETQNAGSTLELAGSLDFVFGLGDTLCLTWDSTASKWFEVSRSNN